MDSKLCAIPTCKKLKVIGRFCVLHYGNKFWMKIRCCLEEIYKTQGNLHMHLNQVLSDPVTLKDFSTFLNFVRIGHNLQDLKIIFQVFSGKNNCIVSKKAVINLILMPSSNWDVDEEPVTIPRLTPKAMKTAEISRARNLSPFSAYKERLSQALQEKFYCSREAFQKFNKNGALGYFEVSRMLETLGIGFNEKTVKALLMKICQGKKMNELQFRALWFNKNVLCFKENCSMDAENFGLCKAHQRMISDKGKVILEGILSGMDLRTLAKLKDVFMDCETVSIKFIKILFTPYTIPLPEDKWEALTLHINLKNNILKSGDHKKIIRPSKSLHSLKFSNNINVNP